MARFTAQGRLKPLVSNDGMTIRFESKVGNGWGLRFNAPLQVHKRKLRSGACNSSRKVHYSSSSSANKSKQSNAQVGSNGRKDDIFDEIFDDPEVENDDLACFRGLVLDISYRPVNVVCWKRAICLEFMEKVPHLLQVVKRRRIKRNLSRKNILYRDNFTCQYCSSGEYLTIDHILPIARGGEWTWENLVTACAKCNSRKGHKTPEEANMKLMKVPKVPKDFDILAIPLTTTAIKMLRMRKGTPEEWQQYLSMPSSSP